MQLPIHIARKIQQLLMQGERLPSSSMQHTVVTKLLEDGILQKHQTGKTKALLFIQNPANVAAYLHNHFGISNLEDYIQSFESEAQSRSENVLVSGNSKLQQVRTFKGFLVNCYQPVHGFMHGKPVVLEPLPGSYIYLHDYEHFIPDQSITIVGIENPENFRLIEQQRYLFEGIQPLFVSRYPQSNDLVKWLASIPNPYLHFGDLDFAGVRIYLAEFKKYLGDKAGFFLPPGTENLLEQYGNKELFNRQYNPLQSAVNSSSEASIAELIELLLRFKKVLEQEVFIGKR